MDRAAAATSPLGYHCMNHESWSRKDAHTFKYREAQVILSKFYTLPVAGDGACFYAAFAQGLHRGNARPRDPTNIRVKIGKALCDDKTDTLRDQEKVSFIQHGCQASYCKGLRSELIGKVTLADHLIINEAAQLYRVNIEIFTLVKGTLQLNYINGNSQRCVYLWRTESQTDRSGSSDHYDALIPKEEHRRQEEGDDVSKQRAGERQSSSTTATLSLLRLLQLFDNAVKHGWKPDFPVTVARDNLKILGHQGRRLSQS